MLLCFVECHYALMSVIILNDGVLGVVMLSVNVFLCTSIIVGIDN